jgi:myo-inositol-1(or 4)-monophosphatase
LPVADSDIHAARVLVEAAAREAGALALEMSRAPIRQWTKGASSPVSEVDIAADDLLKKILRGAAPGYGWLSEETIDDESRLSRPLTWVVDPIDGTRAFLAGRDDWCVSIALVAEGRPVAGAVFAPAREEMFAAALHHGATLNGAPIRTAPGGDLNGAALAGPRKLVEEFELLQLGATVVPRIGSLALRLAQVSDGRLAAAFASADSHDWDLAAADLLVHEAGGRMTTLGGDELRYNRPVLKHDLLVAAGADRHAFLVAHLGSSQASRT